MHSIISQIISESTLQKALWVDEILGPCTLPALQTLKEHAAAESVIQMRDKFGFFNIVCTQTVHATHCISTVSKVCREWHHRSIIVMSCHGVRACVAMYGGRTYPCPQARLGLQQVLRGNWKLQGSFKGRRCLLVDGMRHA